MIGVFIDSKGVQYDFGKIARIKGQLAEDHLLGGTIPSAQREEFDRIVAEYEQWRKQ